jgi:hypothetical protein
MPHVIETAEQYEQAEICVFEEFEAFEVFEVIRGQRNGRREALGLGGRVNIPSGCPLLELACFV